MNAVLHGVSRDQMMGRHKANHIQVVYAPSDQVADKAAETGAVVAVMDQCRLAGAAGVSLAADRGGAEDVRALLVDGADFAELAEERTAEAGRVNGEIASRVCRDVEAGCQPVGRAVAASKRVSLTRFIERKAPRGSETIWSLMSLARRLA